MGEASRAFPRACPILILRANGDTFLVDTGIARTPLRSTSVSLSSRSLFLLDFSLDWWCPLCILVVVYSGSYLRNVPRGIMRFIGGSNAAVTLQELIGVGNSCLNLETRCSYMYVPKVKAVKRVNCKA